MLAKWVEKIGGGYGRTALSWVGTKILQTPKSYPTLPFQATCKEHLIQPINNQASPILEFFSDGVNRRSEKGHVVAAGTLLWLLAPPHTTGNWTRESLPRKLLLKSIDTNSSKSSEICFLVLKVMMLFKKKLGRDHFLEVIRSRIYFKKVQRQLTDKSSSRSLDSHASPDTPAFLLFLGLSHTSVSHL